MLTLTFWCTYQMVKSIWKIKIQNYRCLDHSFRQSACSDGRYNSNAPLLSRPQRRQSLPRILQNMRRYVEETGPNFKVVQRPVRPTPGSSAWTRRFRHGSKRCSPADKARSVCLAAYIVHLRCAGIARAVAHASRSFSARTLRPLAIFRKHSVQSSLQKDRSKTRRSTLCSVARRAQRLDERMLVPNIMGRIRGYG